MNREEGTARSKKVWEETGKRLAATRKERGKTQEDIGAMFGLEQKQWSKYENGRPIPIYLCLDIAEKLHISLDWLLTGKGTMKNGTQEKAPEEMTVRDVCAALAAMSTVTDMEIAKVESIDSNEYSPDEYGLYIWPKHKKVATANADYEMVDNRGDIIQDFLAQMAADRKNAENETGLFQIPYETKIAGYLSKLPPISLAPVQEIKPVESLDAQKKAHKNSYPHIPWCVMFTRYK